MPQQHAGGTPSGTANEAETPGGQFVRVEFDEGIAWVAINRPEKRNAISVQVATEMAATLDALETDRRCKLMVITGTGDSFHAGMDLKDYFRATDGMPEEEKMRIYRTNGAWQWRQLRYFPKPTIAMVNGWCFGGGLNPVAACDLAIAAEEAVVGISEINWGIIPAGNVLKLLTSVMSERDVMYYTMTGETFNGRQAAQMRLVNEAVPRAQLRQRTAQLARVLMEKNPYALRAGKHAVRRVADLSFDDANDFLYAKLDQSRFLDAEGGRDKGMAQFLDDKTYRPGLGAYKRDS